MDRKHGHVIQFIRANGGALSYRELDRGGIPRAAVSAAVSDHAIQRVRRGWFAIPDAPRDVVRAARVGGAVTAASAARLEGVWLLGDPLLHVRVPSSTGRLRNPDASDEPLDRRRHAVCLHYRTVPVITGARDALPIALAEMLACAEPTAAIVAMDSAVSVGAISVGDLDQVRALAPSSRRSLVDRVNPGSASGIETIVRLFLRTHGIRHRVQVFIPRVGHVDLLVGDRLVIEVDGEGFHTGPEFEADRRRDFELVMRGYTVVRLSYRMVLNEWDAVSSGILELVRRGGHRWGHRAAEHSAAAVPFRRLDRLAFA
ncbi:uncharacterized protein DUF559 [Agromyces ramosus]|uniref:Uncharacterized protein DUF559 n=1 Tax=Agromyces ramosus TaxID=33879 RepID=A0A4Q7MJT2_9MICO|nr:DUF559 domain-containing protein [Agromyces ramosus]RZS68621.1 uncharacterized protein DUF559 [Agromyces ramosus]